MAEAKKRPWPMQELLKLGRKAGGIDADDFEAAVEIVEARRALTRGIGYRDHVALDFQPDLGTDRERDLGPRDLRLVTIYLAWGRALLDRLALRAHRIAEQVEASTRPLDVGALVAALGLWDRLAEDHDRGRSTERHQPAPHQMVLPIPALMLAPPMASPPRAMARPADATPRFIAEPIRRPDLPGYRRR